MTNLRVMSPFLSAKFLGLVLLVFGLQVALVFWLSDRRGSKPARHLPQPGLMLVENDSQGFLRYWDASLFALPQIEGFSGVAWLRSPPVEHKAFDWTESPRWLPFQLGPVKAMLSEALPYVTKPLEPVVQRPEPDLAVPGMLNVGFFPEKSHIQVLSGAEEFRVANSMQLVSWPHSELLSNSVIQVVAKADGMILSAALLSGCGSSAADGYALALARSLRIEPAPANDQLRWAILSFEWHTIVPASEGKGP